MKKDRKTYEGFSLVETLFSIVILSMVMLFVASMLNTVIKTSHTANSKNMARSDINYVMDVYDRTLSNAKLEDVRMYNSSNVRKFGFNDNGIPVIKTVVEGVGNTYVEGDSIPESINEIHVRLYGYDTWSCLGYFKYKSESDKEYGFIVKATSNNLDIDTHDTCFAENSPITILHSYSVDVSKFSIQYIDIGDGVNSMFVIDSEFTPLYWPMSNSFALVTKGVSRKIVVSTRALTRY